MSNSLSARRAKINPLLGVPRPVDDDAIPFRDLLDLARQFAGNDVTWPHAAVAWAVDGETDFTGERFHIGELTHEPHAAMLDALINSLPAIDLTASTSTIINDSAARPDFENVCPVRFLALFPIPGPDEPLGYLLIYEARPAVLQPSGHRALELIANQFAALHELRETRSSLHQTLNMLDDAQSRLDATTHRAREGVWVFDEQGRTQFANEHLCDLLGYEAGEMMGRSVSDFVHADSLADISPSHWPLPNCESHNTLRFVRADGHSLWANVWCKPLHGPDQALLGRIGLLTPVDVQPAARRSRFERD